MSNGLILWEGHSKLDGKPIVVIATGLKTGSTNSKTGEMVQTYILRRDVAPMEAVKTGEDASICGACPHRGDGTGKGRSCYVTLMHGPRGVYSAYRNGSYPKASTLQEVAEALEGRTIRLGTYGDPAAAPLELWLATLLRASGHTAYTHQWRAAHHGFASFCMASVDNLDEMHEAQAAGYRTFRVSPGIGEQTEQEIVCPASEEAGKRTTCENCQLCAGTSTKSPKSIVIAAHGSGRKYVATS
jgi:hypothetical protein